MVRHVGSLTCRWSDMLVVWRVDGPTHSWSDTSIIRNVNSLVYRWSETTATSIVRQVDSPTQSDWESTENLHRFWPGVKAGILSNPVLSVIVWMQLSIYKCIYKRIDRTVHLSDRRCVGPAISMLDYRCDAPSMYQTIDICDKAMCRTVYVLDY